MQFYFCAYANVSQTTFNDNMLHINCTPPSCIILKKAFSNANSIDVVRFAPRELEQSQILMEEHNKGKHAVHREFQRLDETVHFHVSHESG